MDVGLREVHIAYRHAASWAATRRARIGDRERSRVRVGVAAVLREIAHWLPPLPGEGSASPQHLRRTNS
jgi:hypothetical protein